MEAIMYYIFCALALGGAFGLLMSRGYVNAVMSMLVSLIGMAGLLFLMKAFFLAFVMLVIYAGAVMVLFVFTVMLIGEEKDSASRYTKFRILALWALFTYFALAFSKITDFKSEGKKELATGLQDYGAVMFSTFLPMFEIVGVLLLVAMVAVIVIAKDPSPVRPKRKML